MTTQKIRSEKPHQEIKSDEAREALYADYDNWKNWAAKDFMKLSHAEARYYADELRGEPLLSKDVLEIGFGNGAFLAYARNAGARVYGTEVLEPARKQAEAAGVTILPLDLAASVAEFKERFAVIAAFDVLEHLEMDEVVRLLDHVAALLADGGVFVARYPNDQSPFGRVHQHGDITHRTILSAEIMQQMLAGRPSRIVHLGNQAPARASGMRRLGSAARTRLQRMVEGSIRRIYGMSAPLGPNSVAVLRRNPRSGASQ